MTYTKYQVKGVHMVLFLSLGIPLVVLLLVQLAMFLLWPQQDKSVEEEAVAAKQAKADAVVDGAAAKAVARERVRRADAMPEASREFVQNVEVPFDGLAENSPALVTAKNAAHKASSRLGPAGMASAAAGPSFEMPAGFVLAEFSGRDS